MGKNSNKKPEAAPAPPALKQTMAKPVATYTDPAALRTLMENAKRLGRTDVWREAFRRLCALEAEGQTEPLLKDFHATLAAYEQLLSEKNGRTTRAGRTRLKLKGKGAVQCLIDWATSKEAPEELLVGREGRVEIFQQRLGLALGLERAQPAECLAP
ncbi:MAG: hypothetical protein EPO67_04080, partial [Reyranella sp.]